MIPMAERQLQPGKVRVCQALPNLNVWYAEKRAHVDANDRWELTTYTVEVFYKHSDALDRALSWLPKVDTP